MKVYDMDEVFFLVEEGKLPPDTKVVLYADARKVEEERNDMLLNPEKYFSAFRDLNTVIKRADLAEEERDRLIMQADNQSSVLAVCEKQIAALTAENAGMKEALEFCSTTLAKYHPDMNPDEPCIFYEMRKIAQQALGKLERDRHFRTQPTSPIA